MSERPPIATFESLDEAESALDWIGVDFVEAEDSFEGDLSGADRELLEAAIGDRDAPGPVRELAIALLETWDRARADTLAYSVAYRP